jgi:methylated-DNA-[protein]-cysteine S-methyltransferase
VTTWTTRIDSPVGALDLIADSAGALTHLLFRGEAHFAALDPALRRDRGPFVEVISQLAGYFAGERTRFELVVAPTGTDFQHAAWAALRAIPYGQTRTYTEQAVAIGRPSAVRAVGAANGRNPIGIVVPCHRVVGADGSLTGYGGGIDRKRWLLALERSRHSPRGGRGGSAPASSGASA